MEEIKILISQRGILKGQLSRFETFLNSPQGHDDKVQLNERLSKCYSLYDSFDAVQTKIEILDDSEDQLSEREMYENKHFKLVSLAKKILNPSIDQQFSSGSNTNASNAEIIYTSDFSGIKLPPIELPSFSGQKYSDWLPFFETFLALVHNHPKISKIQKFYYLQSSLKCEAKEVINSLDITEANYDIAINVLRERYENQRLIINNHVKNIINLQQIQKESHIALRRLIDSIQKDLKALQSLKEPVEYWDTLLIFIITGKLDSVTRREWEIHSLKQNITDFNCFIKFLKDKCQVLETMQSNKFDNKNSVSFQGHHDKYDKSKFKSQTFFVSPKLCAFCEQNHKFFQCRKFLNLSIDDRVNETKRLNLCMICLKSNHKTNTCFWKTRCRHCSGAHNSLLHVNKTQNNAPTQNNSNSTQQSHNNQNHTQTAHVQTHSQYTDTQAQNSQSQEHAHDSLHSSQISNSFTDTKHSVTNLVTNLENCNSNSSYTYSSHSKHSISCLLATANVAIFDSQNELHIVRALLDPGSMTSFMTSSLSDKLGISKQVIQLSVHGVNTAVTSSTKMTHARIKSLYSSYETNVDFYILDKITGQLPMYYIIPQRFLIPEDIFLADKQFYLPGDIDVLLGADIYYELICKNKFKTGENQPYLLETKLGWIISGKYNFHDPKDHNSKPNLNTCCNFTLTQLTPHDDDIILNDQLKKFWEVEEPKISRHFTREEQECEEVFSKTTRYEQDGHFIVTLPVKDNIQELGDNKDIAIKRFYNLERKLQNNPAIRKLYTEFMDTYENLGHMTQIPHHEITDSQHTIYYLPHHPVFKETSISCKLRVVFDASCKSNTGISLNDKLKIGPIIQDDLYSILVRFRKHNYVLGADVAKMYRMVWIEKTQRDLQRIVWRPTPQEELRHFRLNTVTYGTASASFLAIRSLQQAARHFEQNFPSASQSIMQDFYVDDYLSGSDTRDGARKLRKEVSEILSNSGFILRKWTSNDRTLIDEVDEKEMENIEHYITEGTQTKTLGVLWQVDQDVLKYSVTLEDKVKPTKRNILSTISRIFDPLGLIGPVIINAKCILQQLWTEKLDWDDTVSIKLQTAWNELYKELPMLTQVSIPRHVLTFQAIQIELHGYCDASEKAYGACIYARSTDSTDNVITRLLCAKSKVAPLRSISLPRLELCGAVLLSKLMRKTLEALKTHVDNVFYWTDSVIVLSWLALEPAHLKTFVSNRVSEIQQLTNEYSWSHVSSKDNPADIISRGSSPTKLMDTTLWWQGPTWLRKSPHDWPVSPIKLVDPPEKRTLKTQTLTTFCGENLVVRFSSLLKLKKVLAYCFRFTNNCKNSNNKIKGVLSVDEIEHAFEFLIKQAQLQDFALEIGYLQKNKILPKSSKLISLNPFIDSKGILRLGGRISKCQAEFNTKFPIILSGKHPLTELIIRQEHIRNLHMGTQALLSNIRCNFWLVSGRNAVKRVLRKCVVCFRNKPLNINTLMGELPEARVVVSRPFYNAGLDYAGPFYIKTSNLRNSKVIKSYLCIFVCMASRAVHMEVVSDLSTHAFLNALKRFFSRRGKSKHLFSDNGTNFVGANRELQSLTNLLKQNNDILSNSLSQDGIKWHFIPPRSAHFGGLWESCVKSAKYHLKRVIGDVHLTFEEFSTIVAQVEACMNSRPICPLSDDPSDLNPLTPGHFLIGGSLVALPQSDYKDIPFNRLSRYQHLSKILQHFWHRWSAEYLPSLNPRSKWWQDNSKMLKENTMVLLKDEALPPLKWSLGRFVALHPGEDNVVRVVSVRTSSGITKRAISKIAVLPIDK